MTNNSVENVEGYLQIGLNQDEMDVGPSGWSFADLLAAPNDSAERLSIEEWLNKFDHRHVRITVEVLDEPEY